MKCHSSYPHLLSKKKFLSEKRISLYLIFMLETGHINKVILHGIYMYRVFCHFVCVCVCTHM